MQRQTNYPQKLHRQSFVKGDLIEKKHAVVNMKCMNEIHGTITARMQYTN
jgi:hypothetical protein